jgi:hypothetical protein
MIHKSANLFGFDGISLADFTKAGTIGMAECSIQNDGKIEQIAIVFTNDTKVKTIADVKPEIVLLFEDTEEIDDLISLLHRAKIRKITNDTSNGIPYESSKS